MDDFTTLTYDTVFGEGQCLPAKSSTRQKAARPPVQSTLVRPGPALRTGERGLRTGRPKGMKKPEPAIVPPQRRGVDAVS